MDIQFIFIGHGIYPSAMVESVRMITGIKDDLHIVELHDDEDGNIFETKLNKTIDALREAKQIIIFADLLGGSPANSALKLYASNEKVTIIAGANVPLILASVLTKDIQRSFEESRISIVDVKAFVNEFEDDE